MIELREVGRRFAAGVRPRGGVVALRDVSLDVPHGEITGVVGPNGAGKSTLLGLVLGFLRPTTGSLAIDGLSPRDYVRRHGSCFLPERFSVPPSWPVRRALVALARLGGAGRASRGRSAEVLERFGLEAYASREAGTLSRGLVQRLGLAQALLVPRPLVVLDEPTEGLDPRGRLLLREVLAELRAAGHTVILATQDLAELERAADRAIVLDAGVVRETLELRGPDERMAYELHTTTAAPALRELLPDAVPIGTAGTGGGGAVHRLAFTVADAADLSVRLAAILAAGVVVVEVRPAVRSLEERVQRALDDGTA